MKDFLITNAVFIIPILLILLLIVIFMYIGVTIKKDNFERESSYLNKRLDSQIDTIKDLRDENLEILKSLRIERNKHLDNKNVMFITNEGDIARSVRSVAIFDKNKNFSHIDSFIKRKKGDRFINEKVYPIFVKHYINKNS